MNKVKILSNAPASVILFNAMSSVGDASDMLKTFNIDKSDGDNTEVSVEVFVNGVAVPFVGALDKALEAIKKKIDAEIREAAVKLVSGTVLADLISEIEQAEWKIRAAIEKIPEPD